MNTLSYRSTFAGILCLWCSLSIQANNHLSSSTLEFQQTANMHIAGIGTTSPSHKLHVVGNIHGSTFTASNPPSWLGYVFEDTFELSKIEEVEKYIEENHHLKDIPSAAEVEANGVDIVEMKPSFCRRSRS